MGDSRDHILKTSFKLFLQKGYKEVTLNEIVNETKLSKGAFYHYFSSKEQLYFEIINVYYLKVIHTNYDQFNQYSLNKFYHEYAVFLGQSLDVIKFVFDDHGSKLCDFNYFAFGFEAIRHSSNFQEKIKEIHLEELEAWVKIVKTARENKEIATLLGDEQIAKIFIFINNSIWLHSIFLDQSDSIDTILVEMVNLWDGFYKEIVK
jgi:TetR/AcrR family transcriptional regulator, transcriptional repressor for nem operon